MLAIVINTLVVESPETRRGGGEGRADVLSILQTDRSEILGPNQRLTLSQQKIEARWPHAAIYKDVKNMWECTLTSQYIFTTLYLVKHKYIIIRGPG